MAKLSKRDLILNSIINAYINDNLPIGSSELGSRMDIAIPASTIRVYFKKLSDEGQITQLHISGGRMPTTSAMRVFWSDFFTEFDDDIDIKNSMVLKFLCQKYELYSMIFENFDQNLNEILNFKDRFLILNFTNDEIILKYDIRVDKFLSNLIGVGLNKLETISSQVGLSELKRKISELKRAKICFQENEIIALNAFGNEKFKLILDPGFEAYMGEILTFSPIFDSEFMGLKLNVLYQGQNATMICVGSIYANYIKFLKEIKEAA